MSSNTLTQQDAVTGADLVTLFSALNGSWRTANITALQAFMQANLTLPVTVQQYFAPTATGFTVYVADALTHIWAIIAPTGTMASGTIVLPATPPNRQLVDVNTTQAITALTINGNGKSVAGGPATLAINGFFRLRYDVVTSTWRQVA